MVFIVIIQSHLRYALPQKTIMMVYIMTIQGQLSYARLLRKCVNNQSHFQVMSENFGLQQFWAVIIKLKIGHASRRRNQKSQTAPRQGPNL